MPCAGDEVHRLVEVVGGGQQVGVRPEPVAFACCRSAGPWPPTRWRRPAAGAAAARRPTSVANVCSAGPPEARPAAHRLGQRGVPGQPVVGRGRDDGVHPALDQREQRLQPAQRHLLLRRLLGLEQAAAQQPLDALGVARVEAALHRRRHGLGDAPLDGLAVDRDAPGVGVHGVLQLLAQPRHVGEQPLGGGLAQREEEPDLVGRAGRARPRTRPRSAAPGRRCRRGPAAARRRCWSATSSASLPSAWPTWAPNIRPPIRPMIPAIGPNDIAASCGIALVIAATTFSASGSISCGPGRQGELDPLHA